ncbi:ABC transporter ATP-binding protein [Rhodococcoides kyotonense]|uniref:ABC-type multidrug transport system, ATPase and permease component n=1 Tax=Rhodococcoides kyotonense TaxID=398843 RepID=A0A239GA46_9NOCA|nr:ABC transporter ATP-binding protein [Rhodococcus kyotonensis]SNS65582.1 ABC-type multidrug transport system, ATPase and permease component [Rhodococcus kyotonensis]
MTRWWLTAALAVVAASGRIVVPLTVQYALDHALLDESAQDRTTVLIHSVLVGAVAVAIAGTSSCLLNRRLVSFVETALAALRERAFEHMFRLSPASVATIGTGTLVARLTGDIDTISQFTRAGGITLVINVSQMIVAATVMFVFSWPLALLVIGVTGVTVVLMRLIQRVVARRFAVVRVEVGALYDGMSDLVNGAEMIRAFGAGQKYETRVGDLVERTRRAQMNTQLPLNFNASLGEAASGVITSAVVVAGAAAGAGYLGWIDLTAGQLVAFLFLITFFVRPMQFTVSMLGEAQSAVAGWRRVQELLAEPVETVSDDDGVALPDGGIALHLSGIRFGYDASSTALEIPELHIDAHEHVAVVGHTGSGKSTFAKLLTRQLTPTEGVVSLASVNLSRVAPASLARRVAIVPQDAFLFDRTVAENIAVARPEATHSEVMDTVRDLGLDDWVRGLPAGLDTRVGAHGEALSAGERQLVALARTALVDPDLLVLDEATSGVDPATDVRVQRALLRLTKGRTTVTIAHRMITAENADRILLFEDGKLAEQGTHEELAASGGRYASMFRAWTAMNTL